MNGSLIRMLENPARRMQRLGFLKQLVSRSSHSATSSMQIIGNDLINTVSKKVLAPASDELSAYVRVVFPGQASKPLLGKIRTAMGESPPHNTISVELQDAYLSSKDLPSRRGRLVSNDWKNYPYLAIGLGLIRKESFAALVRGVVFLRLVSPKEIKAFTEYSTDTNPLILTMPQKLFLLETFIEHDYHILLPLYRSLLMRNGEFTDWETGDLLPDIMRDLNRSLRDSVRSGADSMRLQKILDTAKVIEQWRGRQYKGTGARDAAATLRLEPFVDLGILNKRDPFAYRYGFSQAGRSVMTKLTSIKDEREALDGMFFRAAVESYELASEHLTDTDTVLSIIYESFRAITSPLGYAPIREVLILAAISAIEKGAGYFEISEGLQVLKRTQQQHPNTVRFNVDRWGNLTFVKFTKKP